ncbi:hypothetical protein [Ruicaihuangia caeni]|uniref:ATP synthase protein I n=1 Tax=Ruicaihuangia caeni TaxID=3042517 RepID=A0AAW6T8K2_9MICO|nr:hypothetical protein [Klugiella sp. YN-L-19]MDI2097472.1 hypothetical protein [Klugiella sp. YN-L-19]
MSAAPALKKALVYGLVLAGVIAVVGGVVGGFIDGWVGVTSALIGTAMSAVFVAITAGSILLAGRTSKTGMLSPAFFGIVMGAWLVKFIVFLVLVFVLRDQPFVNPAVLFWTIVVAVIGSLAVDLIAVSRARVPYVSDVRMPGDPDSRDRSA